MACIPGNLHMYTHAISSHQIFWLHPPKRGRNTQLMFVAISTTASRPGQDIAFSLLSVYIYICIYIYIHVYIYIYVYI